MATTDNIALLNVFFIAAVDIFIYAKANLLIIISKNIQNFDNIKKLTLIFILSQVHCFKITNPYNYVVYKRVVYKKYQISFFHQLLLYLQVEQIPLITHYGLQRT